MWDEFNKLAEFLHKQLGESTALYLLNSGNLGDQLIDYANQQFFNYYQINYKAIHRKFPNKLVLILGLLSLIPYRLRFKNLIYGGGGGFSNNYQHSQWILRWANLLGYRITVLPSSFEIKPPLTEQISYFARDTQESLAMIKPQHFCHEMACFLKLIPVEIIQPKTGNGKAYCFRYDKEKSLISIPANNYDVSLSSKSLIDMINYLNKFQTIYTNRLHVAILGSLLNKEVLLYPSRYFKNKRIYQATLSKYFTNIQYLDRNNKV